MKINFKLNSIIVLGLTMPIAASSYADMVVTNTLGEKAYIKQAKTKQKMADTTIIFDYKNDRVSLIDDKHHLYAHGSSQEFCQSIKEPVEEFTNGMDAMREAIMAKHMAKMSADQQKQMRADMSAEKKSVVKFINQGSGGLVAGYKTEKYQIIENGEVVQYLWLSDNKKLREESADIVNIGKGIFSCDLNHSITGNKHYSDSEQYTALMKKGFELRSVSGNSAVYNYENGETLNTIAHVEGSSVNEVAKVSFKSLSASIFMVPSKYTKMTITEYQSYQTEKALENFDAHNIDSSEPDLGVETNQETLVEKSQQQVQNKITEIPDRVEKGVEKKLEDSIEEKIEEKLTEYIPSWFLD